MNCLSSRTCRVRKAVPTVVSKPQCSQCAQKAPRARLRSLRQERNVQTYAAQPNTKIQAEKAKAHVALFSTQGIFALWYIVGHAVLSNNDPLTFALCREFFSTIVLLGLAQAKEGDLLVKNKRDLIDVFVLGMLCYSIVMGFMFAIADLPEVQVAIAQPLVPALALGMSAIAGTETLSWVAGLGIVCSIGGAVSFTYFNSAGSEAANGTPFGYCALALELLAYAGQMVYLPKISKKYGTISLTAMYYTIASFATAITLGLRERDQLGSMLSEMKALADPVVGGTLAFAIIGPTVFAFTAMSFSSQKLKPSITSSYITLQPMIVAVLSLLLFGKVLDAPEIASGLVVLLGLYFSTIGNPRVDREWAEYVSDLPTNVPMTIATVADATVDAASTVREATADAASTVRDVTVDAASNVREDVSGIIETGMDKLSDLQDRLTPGEDVSSDVASKDVDRSSGS